MSILELPGSRQLSLFGAVEYGESTSALNTIELKAFVPAKDLERSKQFYQDLSFTIALERQRPGLHARRAYQFILQNFYVTKLAHNL